MAKKPNTIYAPGELDKVRGKLGVADDNEAKRMAQILGGEVGYERSAEPEQPKPGKGGRFKHETVELVVGGRGGKNRPKRLVELAGDDEDGRSAPGPLSRIKPGDPADDPSIQLKTSYMERLKMDRYAAQIEFDIKSSAQVLIAMLSFFGETADYVNPHFVTKRINDYYERIEQMVTATRALFPRNNLKRNERLKKTSPFVFSVLDTIRYWNIESIASSIAKIQSHPRAAKVSEFADIIRAVYKPLFVLEQLDMENHIKGCYKLLYKILYLDNPMDAKDKFQELIRTALASFAYVRRDVHFCLHPLLMKLISDRWLPYERLFIDRRFRFMAFLNVTAQDQISAVDMSPQQVESGDIDALKEDIQKEQEEAKAAAAEAEKSAETEETEKAEENPNDPEVIERKAREAAREAERKALGRSLAAMEALFPQAGWDQLQEYPDFYPYFAATYSLKKGYELIAPTDPLQQIAVLMHILEDFFMALRYVSFGIVAGSDGSPVRIDEYLGDIINNWRRYIDDSFVKEYLPRLAEYCRILENSAESRTSVYAKKTLTELHWVKRLYFLPFYKFESVGGPPFQKQDVTAIYAEIRTLRKYLTAVAVGIEQATRQGGAGAKAPCDGIDNPWDPFHFEIPNPVSRRLNMLLAPGKRNNASLIFFSLSAATVLDSLINNESSWAYGSRPGPLFRSVNGEGVTPMFGVDKKLDAEAIFKDALKRKKEGR
jgi:hypothetical protein